MRPLEFRKSTSGCTEGGRTKEKEMSKCGAYSGQGKENDNSVVIEAGNIRVLGFSGFRFALCVCGLIFRGLVHSNQSFVVVAQRVKPGR
jgi:hypothetical protein